LAVPRKENCLKKQRRKDERNNQIYKKNWFPMAVFLLMAAITIDQVSWCRGNYGMSFGYGVMFSVLTIVFTWAAMPDKEKETKR